MSARGQVIRDVRSRVVGVAAGARGAGEGGEGGEAPPHPRQVQHALLQAFARRRHLQQRLAVEVGDEGGQHERQPLGAAERRVAPPAEPLGAELRRRQVLPESRAGGDGREGAGVRPRRAGDDEFHRGDVEDLNYVR